MTSTLAPNHHRDHPGFAGPSGLLAAVSMLRHGDRAADAEEVVGLTGQDLLVDLGCGPGSGSRHAARTAASVVGVDPAPTMLTVARLATWRRPNLRFVEGAAEGLPLEDASATVVWALATVHHWPDLEGGLAEVRRVLQPGGRFLAVERATTAGATGLASHGWTAEQAAGFGELCRAAGFGDVTVEQREGARGPAHGVLAVEPPAP